MLDVERQLGLRFVMRVRGREVAAERVRSAIEAAHGLDVIVREFPRHAAPASEAECRFVLEIPDIARADIPQNVFDLARQLGETAGLAMTLVEPDIPTIAMAKEQPGAPRSLFGGVGTCAEAPDPNLAKDWHTKTVNASAAWSLTPPPGGKQFGEGIRVGHPDTGWKAHLELDAAALDLARSWDVLDDDPDAEDPLVSSAPIPSPGHGLGTGSVIVSGHASGVLMGIAPKAHLVPIRTTDSVALFFSSNLTRAVDHAILKDCHVISISLGGTLLFHLEETILDAIDRNLIVCAASGNCIWFVPSPAAYSGCIAVAATWSDDSPWQGSSAGVEVDIASPGVNVWVARRDTDRASQTRVAQSTGASPATATVAGAAALWLAFHGRDALIGRYAGTPVRLQHVFATLLKRTARRPDGWPDERYGAGILDVQALLAAPLPSAATIQRDIAVPDPFTFASSAELIANMTSLTPEQAEVRLAALFGQPAARSLAEGRAPGTSSSTDAELHAQELMSILAEHQSAYEDFVDPRHDRAALAVPDARRGGDASPRMPMRSVTRFASESFRDASLRADRDRDH
ncbi:MAG: S8/S53 family peptidase [Thermomicrobiales bacterium]